MARVLQGYVISGLVAAGLLAILGASAAEAKIYIPCTGDRLVTVAEVPAARQPPGRVVHLGYKFPGCLGDGEWVGTSNETDKYYTLNPEQLRGLVQLAGLSELPPAPSRWQFPFQALLIEIFTAGGIVLVGAWQLVKGLFGGGSDA